MTIWLFRGVQESKWLKAKLAENSYVFGEHLDASSRYIAAKAPRVMPTQVTGQALKTAVRLPPPPALMFVCALWGYVYVYVCCICVCG